MKKIVCNLTSVLLLCLAIAACKKDSKEETKKNFLKVDGVEYDISKGYIENFGIDGSGYNFDLTLYSPGITIYEQMGIHDSVSGIGHTIYFQMYSSSSQKLAEGDYTENDSGLAGSFDYANYIVNWDIAQNPGIDFVSIPSATVKVIKSGTEYEFSFSGTDANNKAISGYYKGTLKMYIIPLKKKSLKYKRLYN